MKMIGGTGMPEMENNVLEVILKRRSCRKYAGEAIQEEKMKRILEAGLLAPTSMNKKPCEFYVITDKAVLQKLSKAKKMGAGMLSVCSAAVAVLADSGKSDVWIEDCACALSYMSLTATAEGVGNCWCQIRNRSTLMGKDAEGNVRKALGVTNEKMRLAGILALGMPASEAKPHTEDEADWKKVHKI
jgi:nitroreductase